MKKTYLFLLTALMFAIFACTIPKEIEVRGSLSNIKFETQTDFSETFQTMIKDSFKEDNVIKLLDCINVNDIQTYLVYMMAIDEEFEFKIDGSNLLIGEYESNLIPDGFNYTLENETTVYESDNNDDIKLSFSSFTDVLTGFTFNEESIKAMLWVTSDDDIVKSAKIEMTFVELDGYGNEVASSSKSEVIDDIDITKTSGVTSTNGTYTGNSLPPDGHEMNILTEKINSKKDCKIKVKVTLPAGTTIEGRFANGVPVDIKADILIWFPMDLIAGSNATISFPDDVFEGVGGFIDSVTEYMESLTLVVGMKQNPFKAGTLVMTQEGTPLNIRNQLSGNELKFKLSESDINIIEKIPSFKPAVDIVFQPGASIKIPRALEATYVTFSAQISYMLMGDK